MRNTNLFKITFLLSCVISVNTVLAQGDVSGLIKSGPADATKLAQAYLTPLFKGFGIGLNTGWNNTAHVKNMGRFDLRLSFTGALIPGSAETYDVSKIGLSNNVKPVNASQTIAPTVAGASSAGPQVAVYDNSGREVERFALPQGANLPLVPAAQLQGSVGLPRGIELTLRTLPKINLGNDIGTISMTGGGIKLELLPLIGGKTVNKLLPVDIAIAGGITSFNYKLALDVPPPSGSVPKDAQQSTNFENQLVDAKFTGTNLELILSKTFLVFTPFVSLAHHTSKTDAGLKGNYPIVTGVTGVVVPQKTYTTFTDPVSINSKDVKGFKSNVGFQLNLAFFRFYASYSMAEYNSFNAGIGLGIGK
jgi:hypothetical protein